MKVKERKQVLKLRKQGLSYNEILVKVRVSKGTLSRWLRNHPLTKEQIERLKAKGKKHRENFGDIMRAKWAEKYKKIMDTYFPPFENSFFMLGLGLYLGEGFKYIRSAIGMSNSDSKILKIFLNWMQEFFEQNNYKVRACIHDNCNEKETKEFWGRELATNPEKVSIFYVRSKVSQKKKDCLKLKFGTGQIVFSNWKVAAKIRKAMDNVPISIRNLEENNE